ncbi:glycoprotein IX (platelet) isoform X1 [Carcharodon carcharias]|uniref:glycoprotein IX (platelet) isoform X1 n=1 Tax=Carcharodon carcharias TaxID=13397 RepID=UPI001B7ED41E|nr:glycoprotein IX (platelet) isoform X1 [Carcharodon carcharias]
MTLHSEHKMSTSAGVALLFLLNLPSVKLCPVSCQCTELGDQGLKVDCSSKHLKEVPGLPGNTVELYLQNNYLTTIAPGMFDKLQNLRKVNLSNNPWECDCHITYLKHWLEDQQLNSNPSVYCSTPVLINGKQLLNLTGNEYVVCTSHELIQCKQLLYRSIWLVAAFLLVFILLLCTVCIAKHLNFWIFMTGSYFLPESPRSRLKGH